MLRLNSGADLTFSFGASRYTAPMIRALMTLRSSPAILSLELVQWVVSESVTVCV